MTFIKVLFVMFILFVGGSYGVLFHSSLPLNGVVQILNKSDNVNIEGVSGSFSKGFGVNKIELKDERGNQFYLENLVLDYDFSDLTKNTDKKQVIIQLINVDRLDIIQGKKSEKSKSQSSKKGKSEVKVSGSSDETVEILVNQVAIKNVTIKKWDEEEGIEIKNFIIENMVIKEDQFIVGNLDIDTNYVSVTGNSELDGGKDSDLDLALNIKLKQRKIKSLKEDVDFQGNFKISSGEAFFDVDMFDGKVVMNMGPDKSGSLSVNEFAVDRYFKKNFPITYLDGKTDLPNSKDIKLDNIKPKGVVTFRLGKSEFTAREEDFRVNKLSSDQTSLELIGHNGKDDVQLSYIMKEKKDSHLKIKFLKVDPARQREKLSLVFFGRPQDVLSSEESVQLKDMEEYLAK